MRKREALIKIKSVYYQEDESDSFEMITPGEYAVNGDCFTLAYNESELTGLEGVRTHLTVEKGRRVILERTGASRTLFTIEQGVRHQCCYDTGFGQMTIGVTGNRLLTTLGEEGGYISFAYSLDVDTELQSTNEIQIVVHAPLSGQKNAETQVKTESQDNV